MSLTNSAAPTLCEEEHTVLRNIAKQAVAYGLRYEKQHRLRHDGGKNGEHLPVDSARYPRPLQTPGASFVTLKIAGELRGCIGSLEARQPLVNDVAHNAYAAAFSDPRFPPLTEREFSQLEFHISVLSPAEPMTFSSEADLSRQIRPGTDGLVLEEGQHRGTFLPTVWESLPGTEQFLQQLKLKAGLPVDYWSDSIKVSRYTTESF
jgi:hypothetical protein